MSEFWVPPPLKKMKGLFPYLSTKLIARKGQDPETFGFC